MAFNNGAARRKFETEWAQLEKEYRAAGMEESLIRDMKEFDLRTLRSERVYREHVQAGVDFNGESCDFEEDGILTGLFMENFSVTMEISYRSEGRYGWIDEMDSEELTVALKALPDTEKEILTLLFEEGKTQEQIAAAMGRNQSWVCREMKKLRNILNKFA